MTNDLPSLISLRRRISDTQSKLRAALDNYHALTADLALAPNQHYMKALRDRIKGLREALIDLQQNYVDVSGL